MILTSPAFEDGQMIPEKYGYRNENISPPVSWAGAPGPTKAFAIICDDPDAPSGEWVHWIIFNIPADTKGLGEGVSKDAVLPNGAYQGMNDFKNTGYDGPCPPSGVHRYRFKIYALKERLALNPGAAKADLLRAMRPLMLAQGQLVGKYGK